jgi:hypothetical protein
MASLYGSISEFQPDSNDVKAYVERVELYFSANKVEENLQVPIFSAPWELQRTLSSVTCWLPQRQSPSLSTT